MKSKERKQVYRFLREQVRPLKCLSLLDRDFQSPSDITPNLKLKANKDEKEGDNLFCSRMWQRHEIENYTWHPAAISRLVAKKKGISEVDAVNEVEAFFRDEQGLVFNADFKSKDRSASNDSLFDKDGHKVADALHATFGLTTADIAKEMRADEIFDDVKTIISEIIELCQ